VTEHGPELIDSLRTELASTYAVERELGGGGMSRVFLARDLSLGRDVVVKVLPPGLAATVSAERFRREIMLSAGLQHPNIVPVLTAGEVGALPYFVMPFVKGESLRTRLLRGPLSVRETVSVLKDVARALAFAHGRGVVHRDIKPDNILLTAGAGGAGVATVADFGVAKAITASRTLPGTAPDASSAERAALGTMTGAGVSLGTPAYMAPEQAVADPSVDQRADLYSLGVVGYEMLVGVPPFHGRPPHAVLAAHLTEPPPPIEARRYDVPEPLVKLVMACLEKDPEHRPKSAAHLLRLLDDNAVTAVETAPTRHGTAHRRRPAPRWPAIVLGAAIAASALAAVVWSIRSGRVPDAAADGTAAPALVPAPPVARPGRSIAVLPLRSAGRDERAGAVAEGLTAELLTAVSQVPGFRVVSQPAATPGPAGAPHATPNAAPNATPNAAPNADVVAAARAAGVALLLEGTVQRERDRLRVSVRLVDAARDSTLWAATHDGSADSTFALQDLVARSVSVALRGLRGAAPHTAASR
jgi:serine/threonine-protein kinase